MPPAGTLLTSSVSSLMEKMPLFRHLGNQHIRREGLKSNGGAPSFSLLIIICDHVDVVVGYENKDVDELRNIRQNK